MNHGLNLENPMEIESLDIPPNLYSVIMRIIEQNKLILEMNQQILQSSAQVPIVAKNRKPTHDLIKNLLER